MSTIRANQWETLDGRGRGVISTTDLDTLRDIPLNYIEDGQQASVNNVGMFTFIKEEGWLPQGVNVQSGDVFPENPSDNQLFILDIDKLYYYSVSRGEWILLVSSDFLASFVDQAEAAALQAKSARDAAFVNADVYDDTAAGLAGTSDGEQFQVAEGAEVVRYRNEAGSAVEVARYPTSQLVRRLPAETRTAAPGNAYPDPNHLDLSGFSGAPVSRLETGDIGVANSHYVIAEETSADFSLFTRHWPIISGRQYRIFTRYGNIFSGGVGAPMDVTLFIEYYSEHPERTPFNEQMPVSVVELSNVTSLAAEARVAYEAAPAGASVARLRFDKVGDGGTNLMVSTIDIRQLVEPDELGDLSYRGVVNSGRVPILAADEPFSLTKSLAGGGVNNRPPIREAVDLVGVGGSGPALQFEGATTVARRMMIALAADVADRSLRVDYLVSRRGPAGDGIPVDVEFGVAWYKNDQSPSSTPETIHGSLEQIDFRTTAYSFSFGRAPLNDLAAPSDAFFAIPFVRFLTDEPGAQPLVLAIDVYVDQGSVEVDEADVITTGYADQITRYDLPLKITLAEAEQLSPADRALREWYYIDGALVHRDDLPAFSAASPSGTIEEPSLDAWEHSVTLDGNDSEVILSARATNIPGMLRRLIAARFDGMQGLTPEVKIIRTGDWNSPRNLSRHRLVWSDDLDGDNWKPFDIEVDNSGTDEEWVFQNVYPFGFSSIYMANLPFYSFGRVLRKDLEWARSSHARPTESAVSGYVIGTTTARTTPYYSKTVPDCDHTAFRVGNGPRTVALSSGVHPDEKPGFYQLEGCMGLILSDTRIGQRLREVFTFYVYPAINRQGLHAGASRWELETGGDANRIFGHEGITTELSEIYERAWAADLAGKDVFATFDFHSTAASDPDTTHAAQLWYLVDNPNPMEVAFLSAMSRFGEFEHVQWTSPNTVTWYMRNIISSAINMTSEFNHDRRVTVNDWRNRGRDIVRALLEVAESME